MSQYFDVSGVNLISAGGGRLYKNKTALNLSDSTVEVISEGINNEIYSFPWSNIGKTTLEIGKDSSGKSINGHIKSIFYYPESLTNQQLKALTTRRETTPLPPANEPNFTMAIAIPSANTTWNLRSTGTVSYDVDWGDGQKEIIQTSNIKAHNYVSPGIYKVIVKIRSGVFRPFYNNNADAERIVSIFPTGTDWTFGTNLAGAFYRAFNLVNMENIYTSNVTDISNAWRDCRSLLSFPLLDTPSVTTVAQAWTGCSSLTSFPAINTAAVTNFSFAWQNCSKLISFPTINTSSGTNFSRAWEGCSSLTSFPLINTVAGTDFNNAWFGCNSLTDFPLINTAAGTSFSLAWYNCSSLTSFPLINTAAGTDFNNAWRDCTSLTSFPLIDTAAGTSFSLAWLNCSSLTSFPLINTAAGTNFSRAWEGCSSLTDFPLINTAAGTDFSRAWYNCNSLTSFPLINTAAGTSFFFAWYNCSSLTSFPLINTAAGTDFNNAWRDCTSLTDFPANMFDTTGTLIATAFSNAFSTCALTVTSIENILTSLVTNGQSNITLTLSGGTNAAKSTWTTAANTAYDTLISRGWTITFNA